MTMLGARGQRIVQAGVAGAGVLIAAATRNEQTHADAPGPSLQLNLHELDVNGDRGTPSSVHELKEWLMVMPVDDKVKSQVIDFGLDMAQDPRVQSAVLDRLGYGRQLQVHQEEMEDKEELIKNLYLQNDRLMSEIDDLRHELKSTLFRPNLDNFSTPSQKPSLATTVSSWVTWFFTPLTTPTTATPSSVVDSEQPSTSSANGSGQSTAASFMDQPGCTNSHATSSAQEEREARQAREARRAQARARDADEAAKQSVLSRYWPIVVAIASMVVMIMLKRKL